MIGTTDHPRTRREQDISPGCRRLDKGSSPHSQGTASPGNMPRRMVRIIPALAGNRMRTVVKRIELRDHPRTRREQCHHLPRASSRTGSSPHSQGTALQLPRRQSRLRIIPALAGNRPGHAHAVPPTADHPRTRREQLRLPLDGDLLLGSSPHSQGTDRLSLHSELLGRIIPALAGNSSLRQRAGVAAGDHPRTRREQRFAPLRFARIRGSSPHSQGTGGRGISQDPEEGIIPALAGNRP